MTINYISPQEFRDEGYLQEVNRLFFHPLGLAIEMIMGTEEQGFAIMRVADLEYLRSLLPDVPEVPDERNEEQVELHSLYERIDKAIEASSRAIFSGVWDYRHDPEGMNFAFKDFPGNEHLPPKTAEEQREEFAHKAQYVRDLWNARKRARIEALRYMVQPTGAGDREELGSDIVKLYGRALGDEMHKVIPVKATSESWQKAARGILDNIAQMFAEEPYDPTTVTPEEVHLIDLLLGPAAVTGAHTRAEAVNMVIDRADFYKGVFETASGYLKRIADGDIPPGMTPQEAADAMLSDLAAELGG